MSPAIRGMAARSNGRSARRRRSTTSHTFLPCANSTTSLTRRKRSAGFLIGVFALVFGFAAIWHIWWLAIVGLIGVAAVAIGYSFAENAGYIIPAATVKATEERNRPPKAPAKTGAGRELELEVL